MLPLVLALAAATAPPKWLEEEAQALRTGLDISFTLEIAKCGEDNAFYYPGLDKVVMCQELLNRPTLATYILKHEVGHAVMDQWGVPHVDPEAGADEVAHLLATPAELIAAAQWHMALHKENPGGGGLHPANLDRAWAALCYVDETPNRACRVYRRAVEASWGRVLELLDERAESDE